MKFASPLHARARTRRRRGLCDPSGLGVCIMYLLLSLRLDCAVVPGAWLRQARIDCLRACSSSVAQCTPYGCARSTGFV